MPPNEVDNPSNIVVGILWLVALFAAPTIQYQLLILGFGILVIFVARASSTNFWNFASWFRRQELSELRGIELKLFATENQLDFLEKSTEFSDQINSLTETIEGNNPKFNNFLVVKGLNGKAFFFDYPTDLFNVQAQSGSNSAQSISTGIGVNINHLQAPEFLLIRRLREDEFKLRQETYSNPDYIRYLHKLPEEQFPAWLPSGRFLCLCTNRDRDRVITFLNNYSSLQGVIEHESFRILSFKENNGLALFIMNIDSTGKNFYRFEEMGMYMLNEDESGLNEKRPD